MLASGVHPKVVQERLGHSSIAVTIDTYSHVVPALQEAAAGRFGELLNLAQTHDVGKMSTEVGNVDREIWQGWQDSNPRPAVLETAALPN